MPKILAANFTFYQSDFMFIILSLCWIDGAFQNGPNYRRMLRFVLTVKELLC
jgi:hypothetical protein